MIYLNLCLTTKTAIHFMKNSFLPLQHTAPFLFFFFTSTGTSLVKTFTQKKNKKMVKTIQIYLC